MTFLDMVRRLAKATQCDPECTAHVREAAQYLGAIMLDEKIMYELWERYEHNGDGLPHWYVPPGERPS
jgi:hypothetical protein